MSENTVKVDAKKEEKPIDTANDLKTAVKKEDVKPSENTVVKKEEAVATVTEPTEEEKKTKVKKRIDDILNKTKQPVKTEARPAVTTADVTTAIDEDADVKKLITEGKVYEAIKLVEKRAGERLINSSKEAVRQDLSIEEQRKNFINTREKANRSVWEKYPEVLDVDEGTKKADEVPIAKALQEVYRQKPYLLEVADGPEVALELAERRLGISESVRSAKEEGRKEGEERVTRATASSAISSTASAGTSTTVTKSSRELSPDEKLVARKLGLTEEEYLSNTGGKTVTGSDYYARNRSVKRKV